MPSKQPVLIHPKTAVSVGFLHDNVGANLEIAKEYDVPEMQKRYRVHEDTAIIVSAGPSLEDYATTLRRDLRKGQRAKSGRGRRRLFCIKHALPRLAALNIVPDYCVILDARPIKGVSTHGVVREGLYESANKSTIFFVASMTDPDTFRYLLDKGHKCILWHAITKGLEKHTGHIKRAVPGGTSAVMRSIGVVHTLGFRKAIMYGMDSSFKDDDLPADLDKDLVNTQGYKYMHVCAENEETGELTPEHYTSGELCAQFQDLEKFLANPLTDIEMSFQTGGLVGDMVKFWPNRTIRENFEDSLL